MAGKTLYVSDLDGTLLLPDQTVGAYTSQVLRRCIDEQNLCFSIATARSMATVRPMLDSLPVSAPLVLTNGSCIYDTRQNAYLDVCYFTPEQAVQLLRCFEEVPLNVFVFTLPHKTRTAAHGNAIVTYHRQLHTAFDQDFRQDRSLRQADKYFVQVAHYGEVPPDRMFYASMNGQKERLQPLHAVLQTIDGVESVFYMDRYDETVWYLELYAASASKANAVKKLAAVVGADRIVAFGDNTNDAGMFAVSDACYAVANAIPELQQAATGIIRSSAEQGVAAFLEETLTYTRNWD